MNSILAQPVKNRVRVIYSLIILILSFVGWTLLWGVRIFGAGIIFALFFTGVTWILSLFIFKAARTNKHILWGLILMFCLSLIPFAIKVQEDKKLPQSLRVERKEDNLLYRAKKISDCSAITNLAKWHECLQKTFSQQSDLAICNQQAELQSERNPRNQLSYYLASCNRAYQEFIR